MDIYCDVSWIFFMDTYIYIYFMIYFQRSKHQMMKAGTPANLDNTNMTNTMGTALIYPHG